MLNVVATLQQRWGNVLTTLESHVVTTSETDVGTTLIFDHATTLWQRQQQGCDNVAVPAGSEQRKSLFYSANISNQFCTAWTTVYCNYFNEIFSPTCPTCGTARCIDNLSFWTRSIYVTWFLSDWWIKIWTF